MNKKNIPVLLKLIGLVIFIYLISTVDFKLLFEKLSDIKISFFIGAFIVMISVVITKSLKWRSILATLNINENVSSCIRLFWLGVYIGIITPGRIGELIKVYFLKLRGHSPLKSIFSVIVDRFLDIITLLIIGWLITLLYLRTLTIHLLIISLTLVLTFLFLFLMLNNKSFINKLFNKIIKKFNTPDIDEYSQLSFKKIWSGIKTLKMKHITRILVYWFLGWLLYFLSHYLLARCLNIQISLINVIIITSLAAIVSILPISIAGIGTRDATIIYLFHSINLSKESALLFSFFILILDLIVVMPGIIPYLQESNKIKSAQNELKNS